MSKVQRESILDYVTYQEQRDTIRASVLETKRVRRIHVGEYLTFLFENEETVRYQIQEMVRVERMVREADIQHEVATYNELIGGPGALGCTLLIEIDDAEVRDIKLRRWLALPEHLYMVVEGGERVSATFDPRQVGTDRVSSVQYLTFDTQGRAPTALGCSMDDPDVGLEIALDDAQQRALRADLA